jgi:hypothetical protein
MSAQLAQTPRTWSAAAPRPHDGQAKSPRREAVEAALRTATRDNPLSAAQVAARCDVDIKMVRNIANKLSNKDQLHNARPGVKPALYVWGPEAPAKPRSKAVATPSCRTRIGSGTYDGAELRPFAGRPGAMVAFDLPSLVDGHRLPHHAPMLLGGKPEVRR